MNGPQFLDEINPTPDELRRWAYTPEAMCPNEDWNLCVTEFENAPQFLEFVSDQACPNRIFFLSCLYLLTGNTVRTPTGRKGIPQLEAIMAMVGPGSPADLRRWVERSRHLLAHPETFDYDLWCNGDLLWNDRKG